MDSEKIVERLEKRFDLDTEDAEKLIKWIAAGCAFKSQSNRAAEAMGMADGIPAGM